VTEVEPRLCYKIAKLIGSILQIILGWLWTRLTVERIVFWTTLPLTVAAAALFFLPRITVEPSGPYDPSQPTPLIFTIINTNIVPLRNVQVGLGVCYFDLGGTKIRSPESGNGEIPKDCSGPSGEIINITGWFFHWLDVDEKAQIPIESGIKNGIDPRQQIDHANITIAVAYSPWWAPWRNIRQFRFVTRKLSDGKTYWSPEPLNK
jgi:hypothetical protein